ncbi:MAG: pyruvate kinase [Proteobacteria bacterium]|nr:pyruvate kinase [Pseudomonadota bacterium]
MQTHGEKNIVKTAPVNSLKTKIVCTIGPSCDSPDMIRSLIEKGMNVARLNFSHGSHDEHLEKITTIRKVSEEMGRSVAILQDLCGPKIRVGKIKDPGISLKAGQSLILTSEDLLGEENRVSVSYKPLPSEVKKGDVILLADGMMELIVHEITGNDIVCDVIIGGTLTSNKGINLPSGTIKAPSLTEKDRVDLDFGIKHDVDYIALSFVRTPEDVIGLKKIINQSGKDIPVVAKIEKHEAITNIEGILDATDAVMVARGDLGVEIPLEQVPELQKMLVRKANEKGKPVIVATQMLRSMVDSPRPTRAEANDVANAVFDGADAVMLSEETASGSYPLAAVEYMAKIALNAEKGYPHDRYLTLTTHEPNIALSVAYASCILAEQLNASAIVASTKSGFTAKQISRFRPYSKIVALSPDKKALRKLALYWGCEPGFVAIPNNTDEMIEKVAESALETGAVQKGDLIVITGGHPVWVEGTTNMMKVKRL